MNKRIVFKSIYKHGSKLYWFEFDSFVKRIEISEFAFYLLIKWIIGLIRLELKDESNLIWIHVLFIYPIMNSKQIELNINSLTKIYLINKN